MKILLAILFLLPSFLRANCFSEVENNLDAWSTVAKDPDASSECLQTFLTSSWHTADDIDSEQAVSENKREVITIYKKHKDVTAEWREAIYLIVASHPNATKKQLEFLSRRSYHSVRLAVANNTNTSLNILSHLSGSNNLDIKTAADANIDIKEKEIQDAKDAKEKEIQDAKDAKEIDRKQAIRDKNKERWNIMGLNYPDFVAKVDAMNIKSDSRYAKIASKIGDTLDKEKLSDQELKESIESTIKDIDRLDKEVQLENENQALINLKLLKINEHKETIDNIEASVLVTFVIGIVVGGIYIKNHPSEFGIHD